MKKLIVLGLSLLIGACAMFQSEQQVQDQQRMYQFMYCAAAHDKMGDIAAQENKYSPSQFTQEDMLSWYNLSGSEAQYATHMYYKLNLKSPMDIAKYNDIYEKIGKTMTLPELAAMLGVSDALKQAEYDVNALAAKIGSRGLIDEANYDVVNEAIDGKCMEAYSEYTTDMNIMMSKAPEATVAARVSGTCVGITDSMSSIAAQTGHYDVAKASAFHSGIMTTFLYAYVNDENSEDAYDHIAVKGNAVYNGQMTDAQLTTELMNCKTVYGVANQYMMANIIGHPAQ